MLEHSVYGKQDIDPLVLLEIKDIILSKVIPNYYNENYNNISFEIEAEYFGQVLASNYINQNLIVKILRTELKKMMILEWVYKNKFYIIKIKVYFLYYILQIYFLEISINNAVFKQLTDEAKFSIIMLAK